MIARQQQGPQRTLSGFVTGDFLCELCGKSMGIMTAAEWRRRRGVHETCSVAAGEPNTMMIPAREDDAAALEGSETLDELSCTQEDIEGEPAYLIAVNSLKAWALDLHQVGGFLLSPPHDWVSRLQHHDAAQSTLTRVIAEIESVFGPEPDPTVAPIPIMDPTR